MSYEAVEPPRRSGPSGGQVVLVGCGGLIAAFGLVCIALVAWLAVQPEGGVKLNNQLSAAERERLAGLEVAVPEAVVYLDRSLWQDGSDVVVVTPAAVIQVMEGRRTEALLRDVTGIRRATDPLLGDTIIMDLTGGRSFGVNVATWNGGDVFAAQLERVWKEATAR